MAKRINLSRQSVWWNARVNFFFGGRMFDKRATLFPSREHQRFLSHCAVSPLYVAAASAADGFMKSLVEQGVSCLGDFVDLMPRFRSGFASLLKTKAENISYVHSTAEAMCQVANGYPFKPGDQILSYVHEYPSNHYPWKLQERRGAELVLLPDARGEGLDQADRLGVWSMKDLERLCTDRTRVVALSHVQFSSGYAADLEELGRFCGERGIDLIIDCAQSLGCLPVYPEQYGISAVASSGWKWLMGPKGGAVLYSSPELRQKITPTFAGPGMMQQMFDYLDHSWNPFTDGRVFEYSTLPWDHVAAFAVIAEDIFMRYPIENIRDEVFRLQDIFLEQLDPELFDVDLFDARHRSGIITIRSKQNHEELIEKLGKAGVVVTERAGNLRLAPHFYLQDQDVSSAAVTFNSLAGEEK